MPFLGERMDRTLQRESKRLSAEGYDRASSMWDRHFVAATREIRERLIETAGLRPGDRVLDVGTGTGAAAFLAAKRVGRTGFVLGIDMSEGMLGKARTNAARRGFTNVRFRRMDATAPRLPDDSFDAVISSFGTPEGVYDGRLVFREWYRILRPGGRLCFVDAAWGQVVDPIRDRPLAHFRANNPSPALAARRRLLNRIREERKHLPCIDADDPRKVKRFMETVGFRDVHITTRRFLGTFPSARTVLNIVLAIDVGDEYAEMSREARAGFRREVLRALHPPESSEGLRLAVKPVFFFGRKAPR